MGELLMTLSTTLGQVCPTFLQVPSHTAYPYITLEPEQSLQGLPWGPRMVIISVKIWSRYAGTQEILKLAREAEAYLQGYHPQAGSLKILESTLTLLKDGQTRVHTFRIKVRLLRGSS
jgi:hypothetical protein